MAVTTNKGYTLIATGASSGTWGAELNTDVFTIIDNNLGGVTSKSLASSNVTLSAAESQNAILRLTGTLSANVQVTTSCIGFFFVENLTTGSFTVTITNGVSGVVAPQSQRMVMIATTANGVRVAADAGFPSGTRMAFQQTTVPTGWTKESSATYNDAAIRLTTGTVSTGGSSGFTTVMTNRTITQANLPNVTLTTSSDGAHTHFTVVNLEQNVTLSASNSLAYYFNNGNDQDYTLRGKADTPTVGVTSSNGAHTHSVSLGGSGTAMSFDVKYVDFSIGAKN